ncbi:hypothetical protein [Peribacillus sp. FSL M8-0224]|uniref:hypothetical protein n=1 Tax=Peribacillus sp. FSL M8-0224 TaxID=2921568 RepID=UPI0030FA008F|nr:hypothetical protein KY492_21075 [Brevibacterium sp. PAMC21349]
MNIIIKAYFHSKETKFLQSGSFPVPSSDLKKGSRLSAAIAAYEWIQKIKKRYNEI